MAAQTPADNLHRNLMVNYIPLTWQNSDMQTFFTTYGEIESAKVVADKATGQSRGYGFVKFVNRKDAESCLEGAQGLQIEGRRLKIQKAELGRGPPGPATIYVSGFDLSNTTDSDIRAIFAPYGNITRLNMHPPQPGKKGVCFLAFEYFAEAQLAVESLQGCRIGDDVINIRLAEATMRAAQEYGMGGPMLPHVAPQPYAQRAPPMWGAQRYQPYKRPTMPTPKPAAPSMQGMTDPNGMPMPMAPNASDGCYCIFLYGVQGLDETFMWKLFSPFGTISSVKHQPGKNYGFVNMPMYLEALNAVNTLNGSRLPGMGQPLQVSFKQ